MACLLERAAVCPGCGTRLDEWQGDDRYEPTEVRCRGCELLEGARENANETPGSKRGVTFRLRPVVPGRE